MKRCPIVVSVALMAGVALAPAVALAEQFRGGATGRPGMGGGHSFSSHPGVPHRVVPHGVIPRPFFPRSFFHSRFPHRGWGFYGYGWPGLYYGSPEYYGQSGYYDQVVTYAQPAVYSRPTISLEPPPPPMPSVVEHPDGRYELRGDGVTAPYRWVWVPNPPPAPPTAGAARPAEESPIYRWSDEQGEVHWTNRSGSIPPEYRSQAERLAP